MNQHKQLVRLLKKIFLHGDFEIYFENVKKKKMKRKFAIYSEEIKWREYFANAEKKSGIKKSIFYKSNSPQKGKV